MSGDPSAPPGPEELADCESRVGAWLERQRVHNPSVLAVESEVDRGSRRWLVRMEGEQKPRFAVWFALRQRTLSLETHLAPAPVEPPAAVQEYLLRANGRLRGVGVSIGAEDAFYVTAEAPVAWVDDGQLDRLLGSVYEATETLFRPVMRLAFGERFSG